MKDDPDADWIDRVPVPALEPIARRKSTKTREVLITFWIGVRGTARRGAETFLVGTPAYPGATVERVVKKALEPIQDGKVHAGREPIPDKAFPCIQIFRGNLVRFYGTFDGNVWFYLPAIEWQGRTPKLKFTPAWDLMHCLKEVDNCRWRQGYWTYGMVSNVADSSRYRVRLLGKLIDGCCTSEASDPTLAHDCRSGLDCRERRTQ